MADVAPQRELREPDTESFETLSETLVDEVTLWGRDPFDVIAALEEELGYPINQH